MKHKWEAGWRLKAVTISSMQVQSVALNTYGYYLLHPIQLPASHHDGTISSPSASLFPTEPGIYCELSIRNEGKDMKGVLETAANRSSRAEGREVFEL